MVGHMMSRCDLKCLKHCLCLMLRQISHRSRCSGLRRSREGQGRNSYLDRFTCSRHFRNFYAHITKHTSFTSSRPADRAHRASSASDPYLLETKAGRKRTICIGDYSWELEKGHRVTEEKKTKNSPERADVTFQ